MNGKYLQRDFVCNNSKVSFEVITSASAHTFVHTCSTNQYSYLVGNLFANRVAFKQI